MPYPTNSSLPQNVKDKIKSPKKRRRWRHVWNSEYNSHGDENRAFASAWSLVQTEGKSTMAKSLAFGTDSSMFNLFLPLAKVKKNDDGSCTVSGYASTPTLDLDGEIVSIDAVRKALPGYWTWRNIREMHQPRAVGVAKEANVDDKGLFLTSRITDKEAVQKCLDEVYKGYSIGGRKLNKVGNEITEIELVEISLVDRPANPDCRINVSKSANSVTGAYLLKAKIPTFRDPASKAVSQMAKAVRTLAKAKNPPAAQDGFSLPAKTACKAHGLVDCTECAKEAKEKTEKRDVKTKERQSLAAQGKALPDGSFPIKNESDLTNARRLAGKSKNPSKARALIRRRAKELGVELPEEWTKKIARDLIAKAIFSQEFDLVKSVSAAPSFLTLKAGNGNGSAPVESTINSLIAGHDEFDLRREVVVPARKDGSESDLFRFSKRDKRLLKRMGVVGSLTYCFDSIRDAQRSLLFEAKREGGDMKDKALAEKLGTLAQGLAAVIGQKAEHEGSEALSLTDADDRNISSIFDEGNLAMNATTGQVDPLEKFLTDLAKAGRAPTRAQHLQIARANLKKARGARKEAAGAIKDVHAMHKGAYLSKAAKKKPEPDTDDFDHEGAMKMLQKAFSAIDRSKTFDKAASVHLKKAASRAGQRGTEANDPEPGFYEVPPGVKDLSPSEMATAGPGGGASGSEPPLHSLDVRFPGKAARQRGFISTTEADALVRAAAAEARVDVLEKMPAGPVHGNRPALFAVPKDGSDTTNKGFFSDPVITKGVDLRSLTSDDEQTRKAGVGRLIGNMIVGGRGRSVFDNEFHGTAGANRT